MATPRVAAGALFFDEAGRILLVKPHYKEGWDIPGGYVEPGESPRAACIREVQEELGVSPAIGGHLVVDWAPAEHEATRCSSSLMVERSTMPPGDKSGFKTANSPNGGSSAMPTLTPTYQPACRAAYTHPSPQGTAAYPHTLSTATSCRQRDPYGID